MSSSRAPFTLLAISDRRLVVDGDLPAWAAALAAARVPALQLREKDLDDRATYELTRAVRVAAPPPFRLLVNARADIALAAGADGVHLPADGVPVAAVRERWGSRLLIGCSTHDEAEVAAAAASGADYVTFGPVQASPDKGPPTGNAALAAVAELGVPVLALGGLGVADVPAVAAAGAAGLAAIRAFHHPADVAALVTAAREAFHP
jgi:thiamine-phosphate pyrophosphorylase